MPPRVANRPLTRPAPANSVLTALPPRRLTGLGPAVMILAAAVALTGANIISPFTTLIPFVWVAAVLIAALSLAGGIRRFQRDGVMNQAIEAVLPRLGAMRPSRDLITPVKWTRGWVGVPALVKIRYASIVDDTSPGFVDEILAGLTRRLGVAYRVRKHDSRRCRLMLELAPPPDPDARKRQRAVEVIHQVLDPRANVTVTLDPEGAASRIDVKHTAGARLVHTQRRLAVERAVSSMLPGRWRAKWDLERDTAQFEVRPQMPDLVLHEPPVRVELTHASYTAFTTGLGVDEDGHVAVWKPSESPHLLIIGGTGSGKTSCQHTVLTDLAWAGWRIWVVDGKRIEFIGFREWPNVELIGASVQQQVRMLHAAHDLMEERYTQIVDGTARAADFDPLVVIIDEYATLKANIENWYRTVKPKNAPPKAPVLAILGNIIRLGRSAKVHIVLGLQRPDVEFLNGEARDNMGARVSFGRLSPQGANMMWDSFTTGVAVPRNKRGRGVALDSDSRPVEIQAFYTPDPAKLEADDALAEKQLAALRPSSSTYPRMMVQPPPPDEEGNAPDYFAWADAPIVPWQAAPADALPASAIAPSNVIRLGRRAEVRFSVVEDDADDTSASGADDEGESEEYDEPVDGPAEELQPGDLIQFDPVLDVWVLAESIEEDVVDEDQLAISYRDPDSGEEGLMVVSESEVLSYRRPIATARG